MLRRNGGAPIDGRTGMALEANEGLEPACRSDSRTDRRTTRPMAARPITVPKGTYQRLKRAQ